MPFDPDEEWLDLSCKAADLGYCRDMASGVDRMNREWADKHRLLRFVIIDITERIDSAVEVSHED